MPRRSRPAALKTRVTHLEMQALPAQRVPMPMGPRLALMLARHIPLAFYRFLYEEVGRPHHWALRRGKDDAALAAAIHAETLEIAVLYVEGAPGGFYELDFARLPETAELLHFGLIPEFQGRGLSRFLLSEAVFSAFARGPARVAVETNTLDSPRALRLYQKMGFEPVAWSETEIEPWP